MDCGAPMPTTFSSEGKLFLCFFADPQIDLKIPVERVIGTDEEVYVLSFNNCIYHRLGSPNDESLKGHRYYKLGLRSYSFYELRQSDLIHQLMSIDSVHPKYNVNSWKNYKHYIITFHDEMFECVAANFEISKEESSMHEQIGKIVNGVFR